MVSINVFKVKNLMCLYKSALIAPITIPIKADKKKSLRNSNITSRLTPQSNSWVGAANLFTV